MTLRRKLLRTIRLDASDTFVFERAATPGEWAVAGTFKFWDVDATALTGRPRQAFRAGFLGLDSFGWSTLAVVSEATDEEREAAIVALARHLVAAHGAPDVEAARAAAEEELRYAEELAAHPPQTLVALQRKAMPDGAIAEQFRTFRAAADAMRGASMPCSAGAFSIVDDEGAVEFDMDGLGDDGGIDLAGLVEAADTARAKE